MKRVIIICEGPTEKEFCTKTLAPFFYEKGIQIQSPLIKKSMGGIVKWTELKKQIMLHLKSDTDAYTTTLIDYYGLYKKYNFPGWVESAKVLDVNKKMDFLEESMLNDIGEGLGRRFLPYLQLHEFEGLLFNELEFFREQIPNEELVGIDELKDVFRKFANPELINNKRETSPSHRLGRIILGYNKVVYGNIMAEAIGLVRIRAKSPRFNSWLDKIEALA